MRLQQAKKLHNRDEVRVRATDGQWEQGYVLGEPKQVGKRILVPVQTHGDGWREVDHTDVR